jgi:MFS family permease
VGKEQQTSRDFAKLWAGQTISNIGGGITGIALPLTAVLVLSANSVQMGILSALDGLAALVFGLLAGVWVDRLRRRPIMMAADLGRAVLLGSIPLAAWLGILGLAQLYIVAALAAILAVFFRVASESFLPVLVPPQQLVAANSRLGTSDALAEIVGPASAGPLVQLIGAPFAILFDSCSFLVSVLSIWLIRAPESRPTLQLAGRGEQRQSAWRESIEGLRMVRENALLRALATSAALFNFFGNFIGALYILYVVRGLHAAPLIPGLLVAAGGVSALTGTLLARRVIRRLGTGLSIGAMLFCYGLFGLLTPLAGGSLGLAVAMLFMAQLFGDASVAIYFIAEISLRQAIIPNAFLGRVNATMQFLSQGPAPVAALIAGLLGATIGLRATILIGVLGVMLAGALLLLSPVRGARSVAVDTGSTGDF